MAFTAVIAIAGGAEVTAAVALAAIAEVGTAMTVVGAVTGNKDLMKIGGVMGLVGGIGGMMAGSATGAMDAAAASDAGNGLSSSAGSSIADTAADAAAASDAGNGLINGEAAPSAGLNPAADLSVAPGTPAAVQTAPVTQPVGTTPQATAPAGATPAVTDVATQSGNLGPAGAQAPTGANAPYTPFEQGFPNPTQTTAGGAPQSSSSYFSKFLDFASKNKELVNSGTQLLGGALKGMNDTDIFNQKMALAQAQFQRANSVGSFAPTAFSPNGIIGRAAA